MIICANDNGFLGFIVSVLYQKTADPNCDYYLPKLVQKITDPKIEPFYVSSLQDIDINENTDAVCIQVGPPVPVFQPSASGVPSLNLSKITISGLSNVLFASKPEVNDPYTVNCTLNFCKAPGYSESIKFNGNFDLKQFCQWPSKADKNPAKFQVEGTGTFNTTITVATAKATITIMPNQNKLQVTLKNFCIDIAVDETTPHTTVKIDGANENWDSFAEQALNDHSTFVSMIAQLNSMFNNQEKLDSLSAFFTEKLNELINSIV